MNASYQTILARAADDLDQVVDDLDLAAQAQALDAEVAWDAARAAARHARDVCAAAQRRRRLARAQLLAVIGEATHG
ncbi:hypothetical protein [Tistrella mobilis]|uniref:Uncharacterized protein n=1 Tax=Tistrella mobilis (strain KA081020-065) TaxID=1110502 RepID=I3TN94_TISMK|nr:hypothetical protein [Tistrella mobilis]AFK54232.1 hypothetical protein TMO_2394 [Tistrella mobilis KA081020-065]